MCHAGTCENPTPQITPSPSSAATAAAASLSERDTAAAVLLAPACAAYQPKAPSSARPLKKRKAQTITGEQSNRPGPALPEPTWQAPGECGSDHLQAADRQRREDERSKQGRRAMQLRQRLDGFSMVVSEPRITVTDPGLTAGGDGRLPAPGYKVGVFTAGIFIGPTGIGAIRLRSVFASASFRLQP